MSCKIRRKKKCITGNVQLNEGIISNTYKDNGYNELIFDLYGQEIAKLCNKFTTEFYNSKTERFSQETIINGTKIGSKIIPNNHVINYPMVAEYVALTIFKNINVSIHSTDGPDIVISGIDKKFNIVFDVKVIHNNEINGNHGEAKILIRNLRNLARTLQRGQDFKDAFNYHKNKANAHINKEKRNRVADLLIYIEIDGNTITDCLIIPFICSIIISSNAVSTKSRITTRNKPMTALRNPQKIFDVETLQEIIIKNFGQTNTQSK